MIEQRCLVRNVVTGENDVYPVWCVMPDGSEKLLSLEDAVSADSPEGSVMVRVSATLYARMYKAGIGRERLPFTAGRFGP